MKPAKTQLFETIDLFAHLLPTQGHIKDFIHHNTLHAFDLLPFPDAVLLASRLFGARSNLEPSEYLGQLTKGRISSEGIKFATQLNPANKTNDLETSADMIQFLQAQTPDAEYQSPSLRWMRDQVLGINLDLFIKPILIRLAAITLDQGLARWSYSLHNDGLWQGLRHCVNRSWVPFHPFSSQACREILKMPLEEALPTLLNKLVGTTGQETLDQYVFEALMMLRGWSGFLNLVGSEPEILRQMRRVSTSEWLAIVLLCEYGFLQKLAGSRGKNFSIAHVVQTRNKFTPSNSLTENQALKIYRDLHHHPTNSNNRLTYDHHYAGIVKIHESWEWTCYEKFLKQLQFSQHDSAGAKKKAAAFQAIFCIDDREFMLRHYLEHANADIETYGAPGFFGVDCHVKTERANFVEKQCPVPVKSNFVLEVRRNKKLKRTSHRIQTRSPIREFARLIWRAPFTAYRLIAAVFAPLSVEQRRISINEFDVAVHVFRNNEEKDTHGLLVGYSLEECATRVGNFLRMIGLVQNFADRIAIVAHGSSSINNPYFSAYDCGACSGRPGGVNALAFCEMANHAEVRKLLVEKSILIPPNVKFVPTIHDTTADKIVLLNPQLAEDRLTSDLVSAIDIALAKNIEFRCRQFKLAPQGTTIDAKKRHVETRAVAWFEPRPEYNHATNFACVVGRRHLTAAIQSDRAVFLHSYDYQLDPDGKILGGILNAVVPVCGGINLEYFFSRLDPEVYGAGSKLPQNVVGLFGVLTGLDSDIRTGLPKQMTEIHDPLRLLLVVEQEKNVVDAVVKQASNIVHWFDNCWIWLVCHDPVTKEQYIYTAHHAEKWRRIER